MSNYMDDEGFIVEYDSGFTDASRIKELEKWIHKMRRKGASIPEAYWRIACLLNTAIDNVREVLVQKGEPTDEC